MKVGILGTGQLARMMALAGHRWGLSTVVVGPPGCAATVAEHRHADLHDAAACDVALSDVDVVTYELEQLPLPTVERIADRKPLFPSPRALAETQDRLREKRFLQRLGIPTAFFASVENVSALRAALGEHGFPLLLKSRCDGYDGKGQRWLRTEADLATVDPAMLPRCIVEGGVAFQRELSLVAVQGRDGTRAFYPLVENEHRRQILVEARAPAPQVSRGFEEEARSIGVRILEDLDYVGVLTIEFFEMDGVLLVNELAPRVHNSGHWTIEGAQTSQFENHLRAILGWPLGSTEARGHAVMTNLIGDVPSLDSLLKIPNAAVHLYGKSPRTGRKVGHVTVVGQVVDRVVRSAKRVAEIVTDMESISS